MRVVLLSSNKFLEPHPVYPLGLDYLARALSGRHDVRILDANLLAGEESLRTALEAFAPDAVGISIRNVDNGSAEATRSFLDDCRRLVQAVREATRGIVILGGSGFSLFPQRMMDELGADYGVAGEGERLAELLEALEAGNTRPDLAGVLFDGAPPCRTAPWNGTPARGNPARNEHLRFYLDRGGVLNLQTKRGCPFQCIYCAYPLLEGKALRLFDARDTARTARTLEDAGARFLYVTDSVFNATEEHSLAVAREMKAAGVTVPWGGFFFPRVADPDYFRCLADCGCTHVEFGTESLSTNMLRAYGKPFEPADVFAAHAGAQEAGLRVAHYFLLGGPGESEETVRETLDRVERLSRSVFFFFCGIRLHPGTRLHAIALGEGSVTPDADLLEPVFYTPLGIDRRRILELLDVAAAGRAHWITPRTAGRVARVTGRLYTLGHTGVLWDRLLG